MATATLEKPVAAESGRIVASGVSFDEFVSSPQFQGRRVEWVAGEVIEKIVELSSNTLRWLRF